MRPISLLNLDTKLVSKVLAEGQKTALRSLIPSNQTAYLYVRFTREGGRLISDIFEISDLLKSKGLLLTADIEKAFGSANQNFLLKVLENYDFNHHFRKWISILLQNQASCVINGGKMKRYFPLKRRTRQGDPISTYRSILVLEIVFIFVKENENVQGLTIFNCQFLYTLLTLMKLLLFSLTKIFSGLKPNKSKCEIAGIDVLKGVEMARCG